MRRSLSLAPHRQTQITKRSLEFVHGKLQPGVDNPVACLNELLLLFWIFSLPQAVLQNNPSHETPQYFLGDSCDSRFKIV